MILNRELKNRDIYLNKLISFQDTEPVKIITGIRRCGKSSLLKLMIQNLKKHIFRYFPFEQVLNPVVRLQADVT